MSSQLTSPIAEKVHEVITSMCADPGRSFSKEAHAAPLYKILPKSKIPKKVANLFVEVTTFTAAFTEIRTTESMDALKKLCAIKGAVVDNLLHCIANMSDSEQTQHVIDVAGVLGGSKSRTSKVSFESQRKMARDELARRGSPAYDVTNYASK
jgi:enoyl-[acyl-carrier-protein] reductase (NADH)